MMGEQGMGDKQSAQQNHRGVKQHVAQGTR